jgi:hypothetical protein
MATHARLGRLIRLAAIAIAAIVLCAAAYVQIQQHLLRWRAERLLNDIREIQMGKSTWVDAQRMMHRWGKWGMWEVSCSARSCQYHIVLSDSSHALPAYFWTGTHIVTQAGGREYRNWQLRLYSILGGRVAQVYAGFKIKNGFIWTRSFGFLTPRNLNEEGLGDLLIGSTEGSTRLPLVNWESYSQHPEYSIRAAGPCAGCRDGACTICEMISANFTPLVDPGIVNQLLDFNLACVTSWHQCSEPKEIMPATWKIYLQDQRGQVDRISCEIPVEVLSRDSRFALLTEVVSVKTSWDSGFTRYVVRLRGLESLKNGASFGPGLLKEPLIGWSDIGLPGGIRMSQLKSGSRIIFLYEQPLSEQWDVLPGSSGCYVLDTEQNRAAFQRGIALDALSDAH